VRDPIEVLEAALARRPALWRIWCAVNFCKAEFADGTAKEDGPAFRLFRRIFHLECSCCSALRGILAGLLVGFVLGAAAWPR
jgi:hypothetical protein